MGQKKLSCGRPIAIIAVATGLTLVPATTAFANNAEEGEVSLKSSHEPGYTLPAVPPPGDGEDDQDNDASEDELPAKEDAEPEEDSDDPQISILTGKETATATTGIRPTPWRTRTTRTVRPAMI